jgi:hypothetical protein
MSSIAAADGTMGNWLRDIDWRFIVLIVLIAAVGSQLRESLAELVYLLRSIQSDIDDLRRRFAPTDREIKLDREQF